MAKAGREKAPPVMVELSPRGLVPATALDYELITAYRRGQLFDLVPRARARSVDQLRWYWAILGKIVEATGAWPSSEHLHDMLVKEAGFVTRVLNPVNGQWEIARDSIALNAMSPDDANQYVDAALAMLSQALGTDVATLLPARPAKGARHETA